MQPQWRDDLHEIVRVRGGTKRCEVRVVEHDVPGRELEGPRLACGQIPGNRNEIAWNVRTVVDATGRRLESGSTGIAIQLRVRMSQEVVQVVVEDGTPSPDADVIDLVEVPVGARKGFLPQAVGDGAREYEVEVAGRKAAAVAHPLEPGPGLHARPARGRRRVEVVGEV